MSKVENKLINADLVWTVAAILALAFTMYLCNANDLPVSSMAASFVSWIFVLIYRGSSLLERITHRASEQGVVER